MIMMIIIINSGQYKPAQRHHRETPNIYRLGGRSCKKVASEHTLYNTTSAIHKGYYPKEITRKFKTA